MAKNPIKNGNRPSGEPLIGINDIKSLRDANKRQWLIIFTLLILVFAEAMTIISILPLKSVEPVFVAVNQQGERIYYTVIQSNKLTSDSRTELARSFLKDFVVYGNTIGNSSLNRKSDLRKVQTMSTPEVFRTVYDIQQRWVEANPENTRRIEIINTEFSTVDRNRIKITFEAIDTTPPQFGFPYGKEFRSRFAVDMRFGFANYKTTPDKLQLSQNPLGLVVGSYEILKLDETDE